MSRETAISTNIRAIIEQLNLNPIERRRLIDHTRETTKIRPTSLPAKITIGVYGCRDKNIDLKQKILLENNENKKKSNINIIEFKGSDDFKSKILIKNGDIKEEKITNESVISSTGGKVTIGVWGMSNKIEKIMEKQSDVLIGYKLKKAETRQRKPTEQNHVVIEVIIDSVS